MTTKRTINPTVRALAGSALVGPGLFVLFGNLVCAAGQVDEVLRNTSRLGILSSVILMASSDHHWLLQLALRIIWPLLLVIAGAVLFGDDSAEAARRASNTAGCPEPDCAGA